MSAFVRASAILERADNMVFFQCPGCNMLHGITVDGDKTPRWDWNGNVDKPTFTPSILVTYNFGEKREKKVCHSFVTDGRIQFLGDCTHALAGKTVDIPPLEDDE